MIGVGVLSRLINAETANIVFAATIGAFAIVALVMGIVRGDRRRAERADDRVTGSRRLCFRRARA